MRRLVLMVLISSAFLGACTGAPSPSSSPPESGADTAAFDRLAVIQEVEEVLHGLTEAMNSHDPERIFSFYRQDQSFFYLGCTDILYSWGSFSVRVGPYYRNNTDVSFQREILSIQVLSPTVAVAALRGSSTEAESLFWTEVLQRQEDGRWLITYEHESWPGCPIPRGPHMGTEGMEGMIPEDTLRPSGG